MNENDNSSHIHRDFGVIKVKRKVLPSPPKSLPEKPQPLVADVDENDPITLDKVDVNWTALPKTTAAPLEIQASNDQKVAAPVKLGRVSDSSEPCRYIPGVDE